MLPVYRAAGKEFPVTEADRVVVQTPQGPVTLGFNHGRAWSAALAEFARSRA